MVPIGHQPILWHVMQYYSQYGHRDFILCLGYKANVIKDYFLNYKQTATSDCVISDFGKKVEILGERPPDWRVSLVDTGILAQHRRAACSGQASRRGRGDFPRQLQRRTDGRAVAGDDRSLQEERQDRLLHRRSSAFQLSSCRIRRARLGATFAFKSAIGDLDQRWLFHFSQRDLRLYHERRRIGPRAVQSPDRRRGNSWPTSTRASGGRWIRSGTGRCLRRWWSGAKCRGVIPPDVRCKGSVDDERCSFAAPGDRLSVLCLGRPFGRHRDRRRRNAPKHDRARHSP